MENKKTFADNTFEEDCTYLSDKVAITLGKVLYRLHTNNVEIKKEIKEIKILLKEIKDLLQ